MIRNYFLIALRNIRRNKVYSFINMLGLALGIASCLLLALYANDELQYDAHHNELDRLYRITTEFQSERGLDKLASTSPPIAMGLKAEIPEIEEATRLFNPPGVAQQLIKYEDNTFYETGGLIADSTVFNVLSYTLLQGNPSKALTKANSVVLSYPLAKKLFGDEPALDKSITISQGSQTANYIVTGVFIPDTKSHIEVNFFTSITSEGWGAYVTIDPRASQEWAGQNFVPAYVKLSKNHDLLAVEKKMNEVLLARGGESMKALGMKKTLHLEPLADVYLYSDVQKSPRISYLYIMASIAGFLLLIACVNFMNLATAKAAKRATEIGIRKVMGAFRSSLIQQLLGEAVVIVLAAVLAGLALVQVALPFFNEFTGKSLGLASGNLLFLSGTLLVIIAITSLLAGSYPAFYLSSLQPAKVLKSKTGLSNGSGWLRQSLVVFQFVIAIVLVCGVLVISKQLTFLQQRNLGFVADAKVIVPLRTQEARDQYATLKSILQGTSTIQQVSAADYLPGERIWSDMMYYAEGGNMDNAILHFRNRVDHGFIEQLNLQLIAGRTFTTNRAMEADKILVNETSLKKLGIEAAASIGQKIHFDWQGQHYAFEIIGVLKDYHQTSPKDKIEPIIFELATEENSYGSLLASVSTENISESLQTLEKEWKTLIHDTPFEYSFLDENIKKQYTEDKKTASIINTFAGMALIICCLGLYGLSMYMAERRFKEIGIRKVLGASVNQIVGLMSMEFIKLVLIALLISIPISWYLLTQWLESFAFRTTLSPFVFVVAGAASLLVALATVSFESLRASSTNPVNSLRSE